jgi:hypothetical protein
MIPPTNFDLEALEAVLEGQQNLVVRDESEFIRETGIPPEKLEAWLSQEWVACDIAAVMAKKQRVRWGAVLLTRRHGNEVFARLFHPTRGLVVRDIKAESAEQMRAVVRKCGLVESAEQIISEVDVLTEVCRAGTVPTSEIMLRWVAMLRPIQALAQLRTGVDAAPMRRLNASIRAFATACKERGRDQSPQGKFREARLNARFGLGNYRSVLDGFVELKGTAKGVSSRESANYVMHECGLPADQYLDALHMLANDGSDPAAVANPPARVRTALEREQRCAESLERRRSAPLSAPFNEEEAERFDDPVTVERKDRGADRAEPFEDRVMIEIDLAAGIAGLGADQKRAVEARVDGLSLQSSTAAAELGWDQARLEKVRR